MTPEMNTVGLGGLKKKIRGINCTKHSEGKNEKHITWTMGKKKGILGINVSNKQDKFSLQMTFFLPLSAAENSNMDLQVGAAITSC